MKDKKITRKISQGVYVLTTKNAGCIVDAVSLISASDNPIISVSVMKTNFTNEAMKQNDKFALSVIGKNSNGEIIKTFGYNSMRDINKFENVNTTEIEDIKVINDSLGYMVCEKIDQIDDETHTLFLGKLIHADKFSDEEELTYSYFQNHKEDYIKIKTETGKTAWKCKVCGYIYYGEELPENYKCPICGVSSDYFEKI